MRIQHNIMAMNAYRNYNTNTSALSKNLEKLSSGYKINRAGDDAAGLAISEKMRAQITGLNAASKNVKDGISLVKTAEGAMQEIQDMLNRMDYLATQSANGTYDDPVDRKNLQKEVDALKTEINRIADSANFNGIKLLDGSLDSSTTAADAAQAAVDAAKAQDVSVYTESTSDAIKNMMLAQSTSNDPTSTTDGVGKATILETDYSDAGKPGFKVSLNGISHVVTGTDADEIKVTVDGQDIKITDKDIRDYDTSLKKGDKVDSETLAAVIAKKVSTFADTAGNNYDVTADGENLVFAAKDNLTTDPNRHFDVTITGVAKADVAAVADVFTSGALTQTNTAGGEDTTVTVKYTDKDGKEASKDITFKSDTAAAGSATNLIAAINADADLSSLFTAAGNNNGVTLTSKVAGATVKVTELSVKTAGADVVALADGSQTTVGADAYQTGTDGYLNYGTEHVTMSGAPAVDQLASTTLTFTADMLKDGTKITLGDQTYTIAVGEDSKYKDVEGAVYVEGLKASDTDFLEKISSKLSEVAADNKTFTVSHQDGTGGKIGIKQLQEVKDTTDMSTMDKFASYIKVETVDAAKTAEAQKVQDAKIAELQKAADEAKEKIGKPLTLQIGDTSDSFNQMGVKVGDMHVSAMGKGKLNEGTADEKEITKSVAEVDIGSQEGAHEAIDIIKNAINYVSGVRGDLGAVQNRLEHTANNLSVMAENIQDAESTIRDTDIAEEMMSYTKNNILVQSAQAMLAQANAVPQGVLQLLG